MDKDATLTIDPGVRMLFHDGASLIVHGRLEAVGEVGNMIHLRGDRIDNVLPDVGYEVLSGQWGVVIAPESFGNRIEYVEMQSSSTGLRVDSCGDLSRQKLTLVNSWLHNSSGSVFESRYSRRMPTAAVSRVTVGSGLADGW